jgi:hypothetical protein
LLPDGERIAFLKERFSLDLRDRSRKRRLFFLREKPRTRRSDRERDRQKEKGISHPISRVRMN